MFLLFFILSVFWSCVEGASWAAKLFPPRTASPVTTAEPEPITTISTTVSPLTTAKPALRWVDLLRGRSEPVPIVSSDTSFSPFLEASPTTDTTADTESLPTTEPSSAVEESSWTTELITHSTAATSMTGAPVTTFTPVLRWVDVLRGHAEPVERVSAETSHAPSLEVVTATDTTTDTSFQPTTGSSLAECGDHAEVSTSVVEDSPAASTSTHEPEPTLPSQETTTTTHTSTPLSQEPVFRFGFFDIEKDQKTGESSTIDSFNSGTTDNASEVAPEFIQFGDFPPVAVSRAARVSVATVTTTSAPVTTRTVKAKTVFVRQRSRDLNPTWKARGDLLDQIKREESQNGRSRAQFHLLEDRFPGAIEPAELGGFLLVAREPVDQVRSIPREVWVATVAGSGLVVEIKYSDLNTDFRIETEFQILRLLSDLGIARQPIYLSSPGGGFVMQAMYSVVEPAGMSLAAYCQSLQPDSLRVLDLSLTVLQMIELIHTQGVVHGDLSEFAIRLDRNGARLLFAEFEYANFFPDKMDQPRTALVGTLLEDRKEAIALEYLSPWELERVARYTRRDDLFRWIEMTARLLLGSQMDQVLSRTTGGAPEALIAFKLSYPYFAHNGPKRARLWRGTSADGRQAIKANLGAILDIIRNLDIDEDPNYGLIRQHLMEAIALIRGQ